MKCTVITPVGPGHERLAVECRLTVERARQSHPGAFSQIEHLLVDDSRGEFGRSKARNQGVQKAVDAGADWIFFLDADDGMLPGAFAAVASYLPRLDAIWGQIWEVSPGQKMHNPRLPQIRCMDSIHDLLLLDPYMTIQMGHFVRAPLAAENPFREDLNAGEDFEYYLRIWQKYRAEKVPEAFFVNRRGQPSSGPRSAGGGQWRSAVDEMLLHARLSQNVDPAGPDARGRVNRRSLEYRDFLHATGVAADRIPAVALSRALPFHGCVEISCYACESFRMKSENDDLVVSGILWNKTFEPRSLAVWLALCPQKDLVLDIGAYTGLYGLAAASKNPGARVVCFEPMPTNASRIRENLRANLFPNITVEEAAVSKTDAPLVLNVFSGANFLTSGASLVPKTQGETKARLEVRGVCLDRFLQTVSASGAPLNMLLKIDVEGAELDVVQGMGKWADLADVDFLIEVLSDASGAGLTDFFRPRGYLFYKIREDAGEIEPVDVLGGSGDLKDLNRLVTRKTPEQLRQMHGIPVRSRSGIAAR